MEERLSGPKEGGSRERERKLKILIFQVDGTNSGAKGQCEQDSGKSEEPKIITLKAGETLQGARVSTARARPGTRKVSAAGGLADGGGGALSSLFTILHIFFPYSFARLGSGFWT